MTAPKPPARARTANGRFVKATEAPPPPPIATRARKAPAATEPAATASGPIEVYFVRHADAGDPLAWAGDDADRPLSRKGRRQSKRLGRLLDGLGVRIDSCATSPRLRAVDTARLVARAVGTPWAADDRLSVDFGEAELAALLSGLDASVTSVMLVGHDPDFSRAVSWLVGTTIAMPKGTLAVVSLPDRAVAAGRGSLRWLLPPDAVAR